ncbi:MAG: tripartite tricarboxylate transporter substrate binding protein, partial [Alphaproteobacteria bacterium]|nr:tripartite tricarboxylate transporter substrate binding protein [Alphaproteobacteria bacterium]
AALTEALAGAMAEPAFQAEAARQAMPLRPIVGAAYKDYAGMVDARTRDLWRISPWRE